MIFSSFILSVLDMNLQISLALNFSKICFIGMEVD